MRTQDPKTLLTVDAVAFRDGRGGWIGQCLQYDIVARAASLATLPAAIERQAAANLRVNEQLGRARLDGVPPAPDAFWEAFAVGARAPQAADSENVVRLQNLRIVEWE